MDGLSVAGLTEGVIASGCEWRGVIPGAPATKKTGQVIARRRGTGQPFVLPSQRSRQWEQRASLALGARWRMVALTGPVWVTALFYRASHTTADLHGYMQALADALETAGVLADDRQIVSWDGTRKLVDKAHPRVEVTIRWTTA